MLRLVDTEWLQGQDRYSLNLNLYNRIQTCTIHQDNHRELWYHRKTWFLRYPIQSPLKNGCQNLLNKVFFTFIWRVQKLINGIFQDFSMPIPEKLSLICKSNFNSLNLVLITGSKSMIIKARSIGRICILNIFNMPSPTQRPIWFKPPFRVI